jgi:hypothetical protein
MTRRAPWLGGLDGCPENRKTLIRESHMVQVNDLKEQQIVDSIHVLEATMRHFFYRVLRGPRLAAKRRISTRIIGTLGCLLGCWHRISIRASGRFAWLVM